MSTAATETPSNLPPAAGAGQSQEGLADYVRGWWDNLRNGDLGIFPILVGIIVIGAYFQSRNSNFLTAGNFVNLIVQMAPFAIIGMGLVFVLLLGEIDLSVGYVSGMGGVIAAVLLNPDGNQTSTIVAVAAALAVGCAIGLLQGFFVAKIGVPSFVVTLAGLLGWNGVVLLIIGSKGTLVIQDKFIVGLANDNMSEVFSWIVALGSVALYLGIQVATIYRRRKFELPNPPWSIIVIKTVVIAALAVGVVYWANTDRGVPYVGLLMLGLLLFWTFIATRTRFGRHVYSVGGNAEASRRAGISVAGIRLAVFAISGTMAAIGGLVLASRLSSVDTNTGGGSVLLYSIAAAVIGGTSLFGGRGTIRSAVLGAVVIAMIDNGLGLINVSAGTKFIVTGIVLLAAVTLDSLSRRRIVASGRA
jgi:D-xylose transport system permease protein